MFAVFDIAHSSPSGFEDANQLSIVPVKIVAAIKVIITFLSECCSRGRDACFEFSISGRAFLTKIRIVKVISPSARPIARCMGCMSMAKVFNGSSDIPEKVVSRTTPNAPICSATMQAVTLAIIIRRWDALSPAILR